MKRLLFRLLDKDPDGVVVTFRTGSEAQVRGALAEIRALVPDRRHFLCGEVGERMPPLPEIDGVTNIALTPGNLWLQVRRAFRRFRVAQAPVVFDGDFRFDELRWAAWWLAPGRVLAYNPRGERHQLSFRESLASMLFLRGVPVDRIHLRPWHRPKRAAEKVVAIQGHARRAGLRRVAILSPYPPWPLAHGGAVRIYHLIREAAKEFDISLYAFSDGLYDLGPLRELCTSINLVEKRRFDQTRWSSLTPPEVREYESPAMGAAIAAGDHDLLQVEYTQLAAYQGDVLVEHDVTFDLYRQMNDEWNTWRWRRFETKAVERFRRVVVMSDQDARLLDSPATRVIPNGVDLGRFTPVPEQTANRLLFVGSFAHFPNILAFRFFTEKVWPLLAARHPELTVTVGGGRTPELYWRHFTGTSEIPSVERIGLFGFVADVKPLYDAATLVLAPTTVSAGTNLKVLEAMASERAVVATTSGCAGLGLTHGESVWIADDPQGFADGVSQLLEDAPLRHRIADSARAIAVRDFGWKAHGERQIALWKELLP